MLSMPILIKTLPTRNAATIQRSAATYTTRCNYVRTSETAVLQSESDASAYNGCTRNVRVPGTFPIAFIVYAVQPHLSHNYGSYVMQTQLVVTPITQLLLAKCRSCKIVAAC